MIRVEFLGIFRDMTDTNEIQIDATGITDSLTLIKKLCDRFPSLYQYLKSYMDEDEELNSLYGVIALFDGKQICKLSDPIKDNDHITMVLPCCGG